MEDDDFEYEMEDVEGEEAGTLNDDVEDASEDRILIHRTLVHLVQQVPPLYNNKMKEYCGKRFDKVQGWENVGASMIPTMTGPNAKKEFYKIRQRFGKELRKQRSWLKGKSGQQDKGPFVSSWPLFNDCLYLADIITPKKTASSYTSVPKSLTTVPVSSATRKSFPSNSSSLNAGARPSPTPSPSPPAISMRPSPSPSPVVSRSSPSPSTSSMWSSDGDIFMSDGECGEGTSTGFVAPRPITPASQQVLSAMQKAAASARRSAPEPDGFAKKRKKQDEDFMRSMMQQSQALTDVAKQVGQSIVTSAAPSQAPVAPEDPLLGTIKLALQNVPDDKKLQCLMEILTLITSKYTTTSQ